MDAACLRVEQECVIASVPDDVDEPDQEPVAVAGTDPAETVRTDPIPPPDGRVAAVRADEVGHLLVRHAPSFLTSAEPHIIAQ